MEDPCKIVTFGDSITKGFTPYLEKILKEKYIEKDITVINFGISGNTSRDGLRRINIVINERPDVVIVGFGMNDWRKGVSEREFRKNIVNMVDKLEEKDIRVILLTINPKYEGLFKGTDTAVEKYSCIIRDIARSKRLKIADINSFWKKRFKHVKKGLRDSIHPNKLGYLAFCDSLMNVVPQSHTVILWQYNGRECKCNYKCPYCYYSYSPKQKNYFWGKVEDWHHAFKNSFGNQKLFFYLAFGEPTLGKAFYDVVDMIEQEPKWNLRITSNLSQNLERLLNSRLAKEERLNINASFHPTEINIEDFLKKILHLRSNGIEVPIVYVMWPPFLKRFEKDFKIFDKHNFLVHVRRFFGIYRGKIYPEAYTDEERKFIARYCDDATIKYMLNEKPVFNRQTYSGFHFFIVDCTGNIGFDSDCFDFYTKYRTIFGNIIQNNKLKIPLEPLSYPEGYVQGTVDGVSNYIETGYSQLENNNVISFAKQGGVYRTKEGNIFYKNMYNDFNDSRIRAKYYFPPRNFQDRYYIFLRLFKEESLFKSFIFKMKEELKVSVGRNMIIRKTFKYLKNLLKR